MRCAPIRGKNGHGHALQYRSGIRQTSLASTPDAVVRPLVGVAHERFAGLADALVIDQPRLPDECGNESHHRTIDLGHGF
ncbi:hypothetical protein K227x_36510 [Rubripirellula lacrimiformis]|uniref:Uncharacterized protein n=1 Tax=Rubripirellula lacrimiformis TaxID=1930273 RepID=A0A517NDN9_9BACT|nr:hypothetical protein K227x_36510 [Rubripirellula lacrimiformis]